MHREQCKFELAENILKKCLEKRIEILSENHPDTLVTMNDLVELYRLGFKNLNDEMTKQNLSV